MNFISRPRDSPPSIDWVPVSDLSNHRPQLGLIFLLRQTEAISLLALHHLFRFSFLSSLHPSFPLSYPAAMSSPIEVVNMSPEDYRNRKVALITGMTCFVLLFDQLLCSPHLITSTSTRENQSSFIIIIFIIIPAKPNGLHLTPLPFPP